MIFESSPWKQDLRKRKNLIIKYNMADHFEKNDDATYTVIEKAIFYILKAGITSPISSA